MALGLVSAIIAGVGSIIAAASAYYSRQRALPEMKKREICQSLLRLRDALMAIAYTGEDIGRLMTTRTFAIGNDKELRNLIFLLEEQNGNLKNAAEEFSSLASVFEIQAPELQPLIVHINGKRTRIEIIYSVSSRVEHKRRLCTPRRPMNARPLSVEPRQLTPIVEGSRGKLRVEPPGRSREPDVDFDQLVKCIPQLTDFIKAHCPFQYLK